MKTTDFIKENFVADAAEAHQDHEVQMARSDCYNAAKYAIELHKLLKNISEQEGLDGWVSEKITLANDYLRTVTEYLRYEQQSGSSDIASFDPMSATQKLDAALGEGVKSTLEEGAFTWYLKAHGRLLSPLTSDQPYTFRSKEEAVAFAKEKYKTNWQNIVPTTYDVPNSLQDQPDSGWNDQKLKTVHEEEQDVAEGDDQFGSLMSKITSPESVDAREAVALIDDLLHQAGASYKEALDQASTSYGIEPAKLHALYKQHSGSIEESAGGMGAASVATSMGGGNGFANGGPGTISRPRMKKKK